MKLRCLSTVVAVLLAGWANAVDAAMLADAFRVAGLTSLMNHYRDKAITELEGKRSVPEAYPEVFMSYLLRPTMHPRQPRFLTLGCSTYRQVRLRAPR